MQVSRRILVVILILCVLLFAGSTQARGRWVRLGSRTVTDRLDHDTILVTGARGDFRAIKIRVARVGIDFHRVVVHYRSGGDQEVAMRGKVRAGGETRAINLRGRDRVIRSVDFWYDARSITGRNAVVTLYGLD